MPLDLDNWAPLHPTQAATVFQPLPAPWWIGGGWAIDLFLGRQTRPHDDTDIEVLRRDQLAVQRLLTDWDCYEADSGQLYPWRTGVPLHEHVNSIWCRRAPSEPWCLQITFAPAEGDTWHYRRAPAITCSIATLGRVTDDGLPYLCSEIQLLYKAKAPRPKDEHDFDLTLPKLDATQRAWLLNALTVAGHAARWRAQLG